MILSVLAAPSFLYTQHPWVIHKLIMLFSTTRPPPVLFSIFKQKLQILIVIWKITDLLNLYTYGGIFYFGGHTQKCCGEGLWYQGSNTGLPTCKAWALPLVPLCQLTGKEIILSFTIFLLTAISQMHQLSSTSHPLFSPFALSEEVLSPFAACRSY